jgi:hypothetical protein
VEQDHDSIPETAANQRLFVVIFAFLSLAFALVVLRPGYDPRLSPAGTADALENTSRAASSWITSP